MNLLEYPSLYINRYGFGINEFQLLSEHGLIQDDTLTDYSHFWYNNEIFGILCPSSNPPFKTERFPKKLQISGYRLSSVGKGVVPPHETQQST